MEEESAAANPKKPFRLDFAKKTKKLIRKKLSSSTNDLPIQPESQQQQQQQPLDEFQQPVPESPLVIPTIPNSFRLDQGESRSQRKLENSTSINNNNNNRVVDDTTDTTDEAIRALQEDAAAQHLSTDSTSIQTNMDARIDANPDTFQSRRTTKNKSFDEREVRQLHNDLNALPDAMDLQDYQSSRVSIAQFGAAMLRGMGWTGQEDDQDHGNQQNNKKRKLEPGLFRPHRLGLGATPRLETEGGVEEKKSQQSKPRTIANYQQDLKLQKQRAQELAKRHKQQQQEQEQQVAPQQTIQTGSLVLLTNGKRAKIVQWMGVPGLNLIRICYEHQENDNSNNNKNQPFCTIQKSLVDRLLTRQELLQQPFVEINAVQSSSQQSNNVTTRPSKENSGVSSSSSSQQSHAVDTTQQQQKQKQQKSSLKDSFSSSSWVIPHICVRIVTRKLGPTHFRQKGRVVDVDSHGSSTLVVDDHVILDGVPERYLETALPPMGGRIMVVGGPSRYSAGILLERTKESGIVQLDSDHSVVKLSLDDLAEWVGPEDESM